MRTCLLLALCLLPAPALGLGGGYTWEFHQFQIEEGTLGTGVRSEFGVHRVSLLDTGGGLAALMSTAGSLNVESSRTGNTVTTVWSAHYIPPSAGMRVRLDYAWMDDKVPLQYDGEKVGDAQAEYGEFRFAVGGLLPFNFWYLDLDLLDFTWRGFTSDERKFSKWSWNLGGEVGPRFGPLRVGVFHYRDLISDVDAIFDGTETAGTNGVAAHLDWLVFTLGVKFKQYTVLTTDPRHQAYARGKALTIGGSLEFR